jgi:hypothetical protein
MLALIRQMGLADTIVDGGTMTATVTSESSDPAGGTSDSAVPR